MRAVVLMLIALGMSGCSIREQNLRQYTAERTDCPVEKVSITKDGGPTGFHQEWTASGCGGEYNCQTDGSGTTCEETEQSKAAKLKSAQRESKAQLQCPAEEVQIVPKDLNTWTLTGCDRELLCARVEGNTGCDETDTSKQRTYRKVVIDRLALETGCPHAQITIDQQADWTRGTETAYRMTACGKAYVCTTATGRTECKAALAEAAKP